jgi:hypothetical protein
MQSVSYQRKVGNQFLQNFLFFGMVLTIPMLILLMLLGVCMCTIMFIILVIKIEMKLTIYAT